MRETVFCCAAADYAQDKINAAVERIFAAAAGAAALGAHSEVLLKPNLLAKHAPEAAVTTHPAVVRAVIAALQNRSVTKITVADSAGGLYNAAAMKAIYKQSGIAAVCEETGAQLYTACKASVRKAEGKIVRTFNLIEPVHTADFIINLPKLKTHVMTGMTGAVKNLFGTVPGLQKAEFHMRFPDKEKFGDMLVDLCETVRPNLTIVDGVFGMEGDGPAGGAPRSIGVLLGGETPYTLDLAICRIMELDAMAVPYLAAAHARGLCAKALDVNLLQGDTAAANPVKGFRLPDSYTNINFANRAPRAIRWAVPGVEKWIAPRPKIDPAKCVGCAKCAEICPAKTIAVTNGVARINPKKCIRCFCCHEMCPVKAIDVRRFQLFDL